ncbi:MAG: cell division protein ZapA [Terracidiphilus sp.]|jgi:cell division protein ZapA
MAVEPRSRQVANPGEYVTVEIYDQLYHLSGQDHAHIRELAAYVDAKMRAVAAQGRTADSLRVAVLAALNLADELSQATSADVRLGHARAASLRMMLDEVLETGNKATDQGIEKASQQVIKPAS